MRESLDSRAVPGSRLHDGEFAELVDADSPPTASGSLAA